MPSARTFAVLRPTPTGGRFDSGAESPWGEGDFNHDRLADVLDVAEFLATGLFDGGPYRPI